MASETSGDCFIKNIKDVEMSKITLSNAHEKRIAEYCASHDIELNQAIAYNVVMNAFRDEPIVIKDEDGEHDITERIA